jgi:hypothetical protein
VSIPSSSKEIAQLHGFPLISLTNECVKCYGLKTCATLDDDAAGNYFVLATVFPSTKVSLCHDYVFLIFLVLPSG